MKSLSVRMFITLLLSLLLIGLVAGSPSGPPSTACGSMAPDVNQHGAQPQTGQAPYTLSFSKNTYSPNEQITVTLMGDSASDTFRGFFIQPRTDVNSEATVGTFSDTPGDSRNPCSGKTTLSHNSRTDKSSINFKWTAPASDIGPVIFVYTVVKVQATYWVKLEADPITYQAPAGPSSTTTPLPNIVINWDPECGTTKGCYPSSDQCSFNCDYLVKWKPIGDTDVQFTLQRKATGDKWIAAGFSDNRGMGNNSVVECVSVNGTVMVRASYNAPGTKANSVLDTESFGISAEQTSHIDGIMSCTFNRKISADAVTGRKKRAVADGTTFFDLNTEWYLLVAQGDMSGTTKVSHKQTTPEISPKISTEKINFVSVSTSSGVTQRPLVAGEITKGTACGKTEGCFHDCDSSGNKCSFYVGYKENGDDIDMTIQCKQNSNRYCALGLSNDQKMGDDSVMECVADGTSVTVYVSYNNGRDNARLSPGNFGLSKITGSVIDGVLTCSFSRKKTAAAVTGRRKRAAAGQSNYFDMNNDWNLLFATGVSGGGSIVQHDSSPVVSSQIVDFQSFQDMGATAVKNVLVKVHGILMVVAWMLLASIGIVLPRFYKAAWPEEKRVCKEKVWFQIHRACMVLAFLTCATSFVIIFVDVNGYADITGSNFEKAHPIMGIVVMALALINPIMALFRCHPGTPKRSIFNIAHLLVGSGAHIVGIVNLFAGVILAEEHGVPDYIKIILWVFVGWQVLFEIVLHIYQRSTSPTGAFGKGGTEKGDKLALYSGISPGFKGESYELKGPGDSNEGLTNKGDNQDTFKIVALYIHMFVIIGLSVAVCVIIGIAKHGDHEDGDDD